MDVTVRTTVKFVIHTSRELVETDERSILGH